MSSPNNKIPSTIGTEGLSKSARKRLRKKLKRSNGDVNAAETTDNEKEMKKKKLGKGEKDINGEQTSLKDDGEIVSMTSASSTSTVENFGTCVFINEEQKLKKMTEACQTILTCIGEDPTREGLLKTPERWAKALLFFTNGYEKNLADVTNDAVFEENHKEMVLVRDIDIHSLCEHHMVPFTGRVHVAYIPNGKIIGLSKIARISEMYARRLQVQERLTKQIADAIVEAVNPLGVAVVIESSHFCMVMRGVQKVGASTVTSCVRGCFEKDPKTRAEFFSIINRSGRF